VSAMTEPSSMPELDAEGFLVDPNDWTEAVADELARSEGIVLGDDHWDAIRFMRRSTRSTRSRRTRVSSSGTSRSAWGRLRTSACSNCLPTATRGKPASSPA